jgi:hypothetical protein
MERNVTVPIHDVGSKFFVSGKSDGTVVLCVSLNGSTAGPRERK